MVYSRLLLIASMSVAFWGEMLPPAHAQSSLGRQLAPGVLKTIPATPLEEETFSGPRTFHDLSDKLQEWQPNYWPPASTLFEQVQGVTFRRAIWQLEFTFKPVRMIEVELPDGRGGTSPQVVWYLLYRLRNTGSHLQPVAVQDAEGNTVTEVRRVNHDVRCFPTFELQSLDYNLSYADQVLPAAVRAIHAREIRDPRIKLYNSVEVNTTPLAVSTDEVDRSIWAVATWRDVDPRTDFLSVLVRGLSNAYQWEEGRPQPEVAAAAGDALKYKTLQLNFWRPGDTVRQTDDEIRYGMPDDLQGQDAERANKLYGVEKPTSHRWIYTP